MKDEAMYSAEKLWKEHEPYIRKFCTFKLKSLPDRVNDCVQDVFLDLLLAIESGKAIAYPKAWLTKVANNKTNDIYKETKRKRENVVSLTDELAATVPDKKAEAFDEAELSEEDLLSAKDGFLKSLSAEEKTLFHERFVLKKKAKEIALKLGTTESNVRKKIFRLKNKAKEFAKTYVENRQK